jgi:hypothetical protein
MNSQNKSNTNTNTRQARTPGIPSSKACTLPVVPDDTDKITGSKIREHLRYFRCRTLKAKKMTKNLNSGKELQSRFRQMMTKLCTPAQLEYTTFDEFRQNPDLYKVQYLNDATRCITTNNLFYKPYYNYFRNISEKILDDRAGEGWDWTMNEVIKHVFYTKEGEAPYLHTTKEPKWITFTKASPFGSTETKKAFQDAIMDKYFGGSTPIAIKTAQSPRPAPTSLAQYRQYEKEGLSPQYVYRISNIVPITINGKTYIVKRMMRFVKQEASEINYKGVAVKRDNQGRDIHKDLTTPISSDKFTHDMHNSEFEYRELITGLLVSRYLNLIYGNAELSQGRGLLCPEIYGLLIVPNYTIPSGPYKDNIVKHEIFEIQEPMHQTFSQWIINNDLNQKDIEHFLEETIYLNDAVNMNEILPTYVERYKKFMKIEDPKKPLFIHLADCKADNFMIDKNNNWKLIDLDGCWYLNDPIASRKNLSIQKNPVTCGLDSIEFFNYNFSNGLVYRPKTKRINKNIKILLDTAGKLEDNTFLQKLMSVERLAYYKELINNITEPYGIYGGKRRTQVRKSRRAMKRRRRSVTRNRK